MSWETDQVLEQVRRLINTKESEFNLLQTRVFTLEKLVADINNTLAKSEPVLSTMVLLSTKPEKPSE